MPFIDTNHQRAAYLIIFLGAALLFALSPFASGLLGIPVMYVVFGPIYRWLRARGLRPGAAAGVTVALGALIIVLPLASVAGIIVNEAQGVAGGVIQSPLLERVSELRIGRVRVGPNIADLGRRLIEFVGRSALGVVGAATRMTLNLAIALFGLYYLLQRHDVVWERMRPYIPFSATNAEKLRERFQGVTISTVIGTGLTATVQGIIVAIGFMVTGLPNAVFWGVIAIVLSILPVVGSGLVWGPGVLALVFDGRYPQAVILVVAGVLAGSVDNFIRPVVYRRWADIHPLITIVGAVAGVRFFGLLGLLIGPLALSYFFELLRMYREEYMSSEPFTTTAELSTKSGAPSP